MVNINETLRQLRLDRGMTQEDVAGQVGLTRQAVSSYESGRTQPGLDILQRLADVYQVELTDIIYGHGRSLRLRRAIRVTAIIMAAVTLVAQLGEALLRWLTNWYFPVTPGLQSEAQMALMETRFRLEDVYNGFEAFYLSLFPLFCIALLVMTLFLPRPERAKIKLLCVAGFAVASMVLILPWALTDRVFSRVNYLFSPINCLIKLAFFLILSLIIDFFRTRHRRKKA